MSSTVSSQVFVSIWNLVVHQCIIDQGGSTYVMLTFLQQKLRSPTLKISTCSLLSYDGHSTKAQGIILNVPISLVDEIVFIDIKVIKSQLDYNLFLRCSHMYSMRTMASTVFRLLMFPHDGNIVTVDQLTYYDPQGPATSEHVIPTIDTTIDSVHPFHIYCRPRIIFQDS